MAVRTETETVVKRILPYLERRGYEIETDLDFETAAETADRYSSGYIDILVTLGKRSPSFLIEAKRISQSLTVKDRDQAISYARSKTVNVPFVVVTNGADIHCYNSKNRKRILWDGKDSDKIPSKGQLRQVMDTLRRDPDACVIGISDDKSLPYRPGLPLRQMNALFNRGHNTIRKMEKNEEHAFSDFSKLLFLKLLEEKSDVEDGFELPYSYTFHELAEIHQSKADQVKNAVISMIESIRDGAAYGKLLDGGIQMKHPKTFLSLVKDLSSVSFYDCSVDSKGAAFEYYVRATLKGKKLGQYFTPRELVQVMSAFVGQDKAANSVLAGTPIKIMDPACGTGGFIVYLMQDAIRKVNDKYSKREITKHHRDDAVMLLKKNVFFGSDANDGVAASAKMNMIVAGDGHTNIQHENSLSKHAANWSAARPDCTLILTNPPFGTSECEALSVDDMAQFSVSSSKGQHLFLQKMIACTLPGGEICTVIDEGVLNTESGTALREHMLHFCRLKAVVSLPAETFKPNKINVKASLLYMEKRDVQDDFDDIYDVALVKISSLGYQGSGDKIRGFDFDRLIREIGTDILAPGENNRSGYFWEAHDVSSGDIYADPAHRLDYKYWETTTRDSIKSLVDAGNPTIGTINTIPTTRGKSPSPDNYVDDTDGYAVVVKAGNIGKSGCLSLDGADWIEKAVYDAYAELSRSGGKEAYIIKKNDILLASTGEGTLGKCCVYTRSAPAVPDTHVTVIRVDPEQMDPSYLADYLRLGFGSVQIDRLYTGSTGMTELTPAQVNSIVIDSKGTVEEQKRLSAQVRKAEKSYAKKREEADSVLVNIKNIL